ncbi:permease-like cell division protein FtsX [Sporosarcina aquimarina]|uniref:Cell division protein FtsX n=1 Tax=Sporosarcina aquimarina TaxID=114975 RepID=A0ABU4G3B5_9BACL|nr:permease-like cell division protein FtsX [Sporosarcina aquimarina]MDW0111453.1 permease-like cell division protein FtsX [Sporosarcina aquimarina]
MKGRTIGRHFRESFKSLGRNGWMTFASISAVAVTLLLVGSFIVVMMNLNKMADNIENDVEIKVVADPAASDEAVEKLQSKVEKIDGIASVDFASREEELDKVIKSYGKELSLYKQSNPLGDALYVKAADPHNTAAIAKEIDTYEYTAEVVYGAGKVEKLFNVVKISRNVGLILILALLFTAMFLISNTIRLTIIARGREIEIMKLVGATNNFVRIPFILEGAWLGIIGSIIPMTAIAVAYQQIHAYWQPKLVNEMFQLLDPIPFIIQVDGLLLFMGVFIGVWGSLMSVRKFLKV